MWEAIASLAWPAIAVVTLYKIWPTITDILKREGTVIKVGNLELTVPEATKNIGKNVSDIQERLSNIEARINNGVQEPPAGADLPRLDAQKRLLWVDDFPTNNAFLLDHFKEKGIEVDISISTQDALKRLNYNGFKAVITDLGRIENNVDNPFAGLDLIVKIRENGSSIPILVFAGQRGLQNRERLISAGAEAVTASGVDVITFVEKHVNVLA